MGPIGAPELIIILLIALLIFGGTKLPKLARSLGQAKNEFESGMKEGHTGHDASATATTTSPPPAPPAPPAATRPADPSTPTKQTD